MPPSLAIVVGLGNPGPGYARTRHNAGFWLADELARRYGGRFSPERRFFGEVASIAVDGRPLRLLKPMTFMNKSGLSVRALAQFHKLAPEQVLVAHDDLDLEPGTVRLKRGGGHGGHNGLRDVSDHLGPEFLRLRFGIGHPRDAHGGDPLDWVLHKPSADDEAKIRDAIDLAADELPNLLAGDGVDRVMEKLNRRG